jgi:hypothetical protein
MAKPTPPPVIHIGGFSQQTSPNSARAGASVSVTSRSDASRTAKSSSKSGEKKPWPYPWAPSDAKDATLNANDPLARNPHPGGPGSFWYSDPSGASCIYNPRVAWGSPACWLIVNNGQPGVNAVAIAASAADSMDLAVPPIEASPTTSAHGLTGERSWFWLDRQPIEQRITVSVGPEVVTVTATPSQVTWLFGDGSSRLGGAGVPYSEGDPPAAAITHLYRTRCLPGDQGRDPYVLSQCASDGYHLAAQVTWTFAFAASGPVSTSGSLPARTTQSALAYPVSEARGFLVGANS